MSKIVEVNPALGHGRRGWLRRQRMARERMVHVKSEQEKREVERIRREHRERVAKELEEETLSSQPRDPRNKDDWDDRQLEVDETEIEEEGDLDEEEEKDSEGEEEGEGYQLQDVDEMTRKQLFREFRWREDPQPPRTSNDKLRERLKELRNAQDHPEEEAEPAGES